MVRWLNKLFEKTSNLIIIIIIIIYDEQISFSTHLITNNYVNYSYRDAAEYFQKKKKKLFVFLFALDCRLLPS